MADPPYAVLTKAQGAATAEWDAEVCTKEKFEDMIIGLQSINSYKATVLFCYCTMDQYDWFKEVLLNAGWAFVGYIIWYINLMPLVMELDVYLLVR